MEKIKAEQSKLPPTPLLGRKVFLDPQEISPARSTTSSLLRQTIYEQQAVEGRSERPKVSDSPSSVARRLGSTVANYTPILNGSAYTRSIEARTSGLVGVAAGLGMSPPPALSVSPPVTLVTTPAATALTTVTATAAAAKDAESKANAGLRPEQRTERILRKLAAQQPQDRIEHLHEAVRPLLDRERERLERERESLERPGGEVGVMAEVVLQDPPLGRERLNSEARSSELRISTGGGSAGSSRSELQAELHQPPRHHRLERQLSNEQLVQARRDELPQELWRERAERERRLERQTSSEQEGAGGQGQGHEARRRDRHRLDRQESSDREHSDRRST